MSKENLVVTLSWEYAKETYGLDLPFLMTAKLTVNELCVSYSESFTMTTEWLICAISKRMNAIMCAISGKSFDWLRSLEKLFVAVARRAVFSSHAVQCNMLATCLAMNIPPASTGGISCSFSVCNLRVCLIESPHVLSAAFCHVSESTSLILVLFCSTTVSHRVPAQRK